MARRRATRVNKSHWYETGGFRESSHFRVQGRDGRWRYYIAYD